MWIALTSDTGGSSFSSHDHLFSAVTLWYVAFPFGPATAGRVEVASIAGNERRIEGKVTCLIAEMSIQREKLAAG